MTDPFAPLEERVRTPDGGGRRQPAPPSGDPAGFSAFYEENFEAVLTFVTRRTSDPHVAADLTADVFVAALEAADRYDSGRGTPIAWLYGIARNVVASHGRGTVRELGAVARLKGRRLLDTEDIAALEERIDAERAVRELAVQHSTLSEPLRAVLDLVAVDGLTPREAAQVLGISQATVRVRLHRARRVLRAGVGGAAGGGGSGGDAGRGVLRSGSGAGGAAGREARGGSGADGMPGAAYGAPGMADGTPGAVHGSPGAAHVTPGAAHGTPGAAHGSPGAAHVTPGTTHVTPGTTHVTPGSPTAHGTPAARQQDEPGVLRQDADRPQLPDTALENAS
ncbi:sigma-70 family RNA polymerase sigma factor [Streptomyces sp. NPDC057257]|uniref:sigma-70 family RNA polymerase sigma factor n=1 Tax=Streptomyces sp. NPDC057257 TaxID=3346071 RepID=UPI00362AE8D8